MYDVNSSLEIGSVVGSSGSYTEIVSAAGGATDAAACVTAGCEALIPRLLVKPVHDKPDGGPPNGGGRTEVCALNPCGKTLTPGAKVGVTTGPAPAATTEAPPKTAGPEDLCVPPATLCAPVPGTNGAVTDANNDAAADEATGVKPVLVQLNLPCEDPLGVAAL